jgi:CheY-like chemotaxis protein
MDSTNMCKLTTPINILVVECNSVSATITTQLLEKSGFKVTFVTRGEDAVRQVLDVPELNLVLMDIDLDTEVNGFDTALEIKKHSAIPIVFHSSHDGHEYISKARQISKYGYVIKNGNHYLLLGEILKFSLTVFELYEMHQLKIESDKYLDDNLENSIIIAAICNRKLEYTWINDPHADFDINSVLGKNDKQIVKNDSTEELYEFKKEILASGCEKESVIRFPLSSGTLVYQVKGYPLLSDHAGVLGVKTISILR